MDNTVKMATFTILPTQNLHEVLLTQKGIRFDLRNLAL